MEKHGLNCQNHDRLVQLGTRYILLGKEQNSLKSHSHDKYQLDFDKSRGLISSSFKFDYKYDPYELEYLHWYDFYNDLENLSQSEFGNCCAINRIMSLFHYDTKDIKDANKKREIEEAKETLRKRYCICEEEEITDKQKESMKEFYKSIGIDL